MNQPCSYIDLSLNDPNFDVKLKPCKKLITCSCFFQNEFYIGLHPAEPGGPHPAGPARERGQLPRGGARPGPARRREVRHEQGGGGGKWSGHEAVLPGQTGRAFPPYFPAKLLRNQSELFFST